MRPRTQIEIAERAWHLDGKLGVELDSHSTQLNALCAVSIERKKRGVKVGNSSRLSLPAYLFLRSAKSFLHAGGQFPSVDPFPRFPLLLSHFTVLYCSESPINSYAM